MSAPGLGFADRVHGLLADAATAYSGTDAGAKVRYIQARLDEPLRVAIAGRVKAGKSTLLNALLGERVAATDAGECTRIVTWYVSGPAYAAWAHTRDGGSRPLDVRPGPTGATLDLSGLRVDDLDRLRVELPTDRLARMTLIDTPGIASLSKAVAARTHEFLTADPGEDGPPDAVVYLLRQLHTSDVNFFEVFRDEQYGGSTPINALGVLSRADEVGGGGPAAMSAASSLAALYRQDPRLRTLMQTVVPVAGLLAETAATLQDEEWALLASIAAIHGSVTDPLLLSAERFMTGTAIPAAPGGRAALLRRLGMYGVRLALEFVRDGTARDREQLAAALLDHSALPQLRGLLLTHFAERRDVLKADGALRALEGILSTSPHPAAPGLRVRVERIRSGAHELAELRLLGELRTGVAAVPDKQRQDMERLLGGDGTAPTARLGLPGDATDQEVGAALSAQHARWQRAAVSPASSPAQSRAAGVLQRTCEGLRSRVQVPVP